MTVLVYKADMSVTGYVMVSAVLFIVAVSSAGAKQVAFTNDQGALCERAAEDASRETGVPLDVLRAVARTETGRTKNGKFGPWPWTVNANGKGYWFESDEQARAFAFGQYKEGARSFDVGCFQINYRWHGHAFRSLEHMFEPKANATYAAKFLLELFREKGEWTQAVGAYHSRTPKFAKTYISNFEKHQAQIGREQDTQQTNINSVVLGTKANRFPLLREVTPGTTHLGSLVPVVQTNPIKGRSLSVRGGLFFE